MQLTRLTRTFCIAMLILPSACISAGRLSSRCGMPPSRAVWATTTRDGRIEGQVRDLKEKTPIGNVEVVLDSGATRQRSDANGGFAFDGVREGRHLISTNAAAYVVHGDTIMMPVRGGLEGTLSLKLRQDILSKCEIYRP
jgi:hypothetical protein